MAFLNSPCYETPKNAIEKKSNNTNRARGKKKTEEKSPAFFVMSPDEFFLFEFFFCVFLTPLVTKRPKNALKINRQKIKNKKIKIK
jgi:hypothetical protein